MDYMCNKCGENEDLRKIRDKEKAMATSFYDAPTTHDESQKEGSIEGVHAISEG